MNTPMMKCGHAANATDGRTGEPCCVICVGLTPNAKIKAETPDLTGRQSKCAYCKKAVPSSMGLAFFEYRPKQEFDEHYDGCRGWD